MRRSDALLLVTAVVLACGGQTLSAGVDGGSDASAGGSDAGFGDGSGGASDDSSGDDGNVVADAEQGADGPVDAPAVPLDCSQPVQYGGSSGTGSVSWAWEETCSNGHTYKAFCDYGQTCDCECNDSAPDGGFTIIDVKMCGGEGFTACGFPCSPADSGACVSYPSPTVDQ